MDQTSGLWSLLEKNGEWIWWSDWKASDIGVQARAKRGTWDQAESETEEWQPLCVSKVVSPRLLHWSWAAWGHLTATRRGPPILSCPMSDHVGAMVISAVRLCPTPHLPQIYEEHQHIYRCPQMGGQDTWTSWRLWWDEGRASCLAKVGPHSAHLANTAADCAVSVNLI